MNNNGNALSRTALTPTNNKVISGDLVTNGLPPIDNNIICSNGFMPINVTRKNPFRKRTTQEFIREWTEWKENSPSLFTAPIVGVVTSTLLEALKKQVQSRLLLLMTNLLFPNNSTSTMEEILRATEQYVQEQLDTVTWNRVSQELEGLKNNLRTFNDQIDDFLQNRVEISPTAMIDSINTMQQVFVNRLPQFQLSDYQLLLLPLFAQGATLHLTFIRDIIINAGEWNIPEAQLNTCKRYLKQYVAQYSNYALSTYEGAFRARFYPRATLENMLQFKTFMTLNVLDLVSIWSLLKYMNLYISTSANLYNIGDNKVNEGEYSISYWPFFNSYIQTKSNYVLSGVSGYAIRWYYLNTFFGEYIQDNLYNIIASYVGGVNGPKIGVQLSTTELDKQIKQQARAGMPTGLDDLSFNCTLRNPTTVPYFACNFQELTSSGTAGTGGFIRSDVFRSEDNICGLGTGYASAWTSYPDYYITNISATVQVDGINIDITPLCFGEDRAITSTHGVNKVIAVYNRKANIAGTNQNGTMIHQAPNDGTGFTVSPLHLASFTHPSEAHIQENYGNSGDSLRLTGPTTAITYMLSGDGRTIYKLVLRVSGVITRITAKVRGNSIGYLEYINTVDNNQGITDNGSKFQDFEFRPTITIDAQTPIVLEFSATSNFDLMNLIFIPYYDTPIY
uniref:Parasporal crystal protein Cry18Ba n=1 Tax=Paenibacillus popilliae TaxID=78057 RepID=C18BA_PAEPP|nr:RecName: Full=Parasporal crystal protein Cry18Ba; AltName: Full=76 kDa crystal protein; AltName: Full=Crystaline parasporal protoxin; AltName: Full=Parasporal delta-endotoxin CryXVIIIB(a) [Paenibacillus popilliae]AAF89667.1 parasporal crystal protein Cry18Ba1 [Paenibacillus popilliae]